MENISQSYKGLQNKQKASKKWNCSASKFNQVNAELMDHVKQIHGFNPKQTNRTHINGAALEQTSGAMTLMDSCTVECLTNMGRNIEPQSRFHSVAVGHPLHKHSTH